ncbi:5289_t:CDS:2 [Cetraspora pellucida]|uniref:5289_t:CDS:1 n=1 Tax=Cetraspora pellucida TaxID=1433469 RepID=A0A9N9EXD0_9GLOM|nr:5289_t:CDS:2 [Cetraspora pellucida]
MSPITRSRTSLLRTSNPNFPTHLDLEEAYDQSVPRIQQDAKQYLEIILDSYEVRELYNPISEEYWFVNNSEALNMVVYYKMKKCLFIKYKQRFINAGLELEFMKNGGSGIGCNKIGCRNIHCDASKYHSGDDDNVICPNSLMYFDSDSYYPELDFSSESSTPYLSRGISMSRTSSALSMIFPHFIPEKLSFKTDDSSSTILGDYVNVSFKTDDSSITDNLVNDVQSTEIHINPHLHHSHRSFHDYFCWFMDLSRLEKFCYICVWLFLILVFWGYLFGSFSDHINGNFGTGVTKEIDGAVRAQVQEFVEKEMFKISDTTEKNDDDDSDGLAGLVRKQLNELEKMMDGTSADYALYTGGARIIPHLTTRDYEAWPTKSYQILWGLLTRKNVIKSNKASIVITPTVNVGECWCFNGTKGQIAIRLSRSIVVTHITYHHIGRQVSIDPISSAPKDFELWGQEVLVIGEILYAKKFYEELKERYNIKVFDSTRREFLVEATAKYENVFIDKFDTEVLDSLSPAVNVIIVIGDSSKLVDVKAATENGVFLADTVTSLSSTKEELELEALNNLDFALITGVPRDPVNKIDEVAEIAAGKTVEYINASGEVVDLDISDIQITL